MRARDDARDESGTRSQADAITGFMHKNGENRQAKFAAAKIRGSYATASQVVLFDGVSGSARASDGCARPAGGCRDHRLPVNLQRLAQASTMFAVFIFYEVAGRLELGWRL